MTLEETLADNARLKSQAHTGAPLLSLLASMLLSMPPMGLSFQAHPCTASIPWL